MQTVAVLGSGKVGEVLADGFLKHGYAVVRGSRDPAKLEGWRQKAGANARTATFGDAAAAAEIVVLAVKGEAAESALELAGERAIAGKVIVDTTNPIAPTPPQHGVLAFFTTLDDSLMERLQKRFSAARFVKAFSCVGNAQMVNPQLSGGPPTMFICGNDDDAKKTVRAILDQFGWDTEDLGAVEAARAIEPLCILWCIPGFLRGSWGHALKMLR